MVAFQNDSRFSKKNKIFLMKKQHTLVTHKNSNLDIPDTTITRSKIITQKYFLNNIYKEFYKIISSSLSVKNKNGYIVELGSGGGFIKKIIPNTVTSDIIELPKI